MLFGEVRWLYSLTMLVCQGLPPADPGDRHAQLATRHSASYSIAPTLDDCRLWRLHVS